MCILLMGVLISMGQFILVTEYSVISKYRAIQEESAICTLGNDSMCDSRKKVRMNMGPISHLTQ
jgi:hypothetical protein